MDSVKDKIVHSSIREITRIGVDAMLPGSSSIGILVKKGSFGGYHLQHHEPKISSLVHGDCLEVDSADLDTHLRQALSTYTSNCRLLAQQLLAHAERLEARATQPESLVYDLPEPEFNYFRNPPEEKPAKRGSGPKLSRSSRSSRSSRGQSQRQGQGLGQDQDPKPSKPPKSEVSLEIFS